MSEGGSKSPDLAEKGSIKTKRESVLLSTSVAAFILSNSGLGIFYCSFQPINQLKLTPIRVCMVIQN